MSIKSRWSIALIAITVIWGWAFVAVHDASSHLEANVLNFYRFMIATLCIFAIGGTRILRVTMKQLVLAILAGCVLFGAFYFQTAGIARTSASNAAFITGMAVVFTPLFAYLISKSRPRVLQLIGAAVAIVGLALLTLDKLTLHNGDILVFVCAVFVGLHIVILSIIAPQSDALTLAGIQIATVATLSGAVALLGSESFVIPNPVDTWEIVVLGTLGTAIAYLVQTKAQEVVPPGNVALIILLEPVFGGIFGYLLGGDVFTTMKLFGAAMVIAGVAIAEAWPGHKLAENDADKVTAECERVDGSGFY